MGKNQRPRIKNREDLLSVLNDKHPQFDYSITTYEEWKNTYPKRITFMCPEHGEQNKGVYDFLNSEYGCVKCADEGRAKKFRRYDIDNFIQKAQEIYGDRFDYSEVKVEDFKNIEENKVIITCKKHNHTFNQIPKNHLNGWYGCHYCGEEERQNSVFEKYGVKNASQSKEIHQRKIETSRKNYGVDYHLQNEDEKEKRKQLYIDRFGVENPQQDPIIRKKTEQTCLERYGAVCYPSSDEYKAWFEENKEELVARMKQGHFDKYGMYYMQTEEGRNWIIEYQNSDYYQNEVVPQKTQRDRETKKRNGTFGTSQWENQAYNWLIALFDNVERQYSCDDYPFSCDFYVADCNLFIELNYFWTHGGKPFEGNEEDNKKLEKWQYHVDNGSKFYKEAIRIWTQKDVEKRNTARKNKLNWVEFFTPQHFEDFATNIMKHKEVAYV